MCSPASAYPIIKPDMSHDNKMTERDDKTETLP